MEQSRIGRALGGPGLGLCLVFKETEPFQRRGASLRLCLVTGINITGSWLMFNEILPSLLLLQCACEGSWSWPVARQAGEGEVVQALHSWRRITPTASPPSHFLQHKRLNARKPEEKVTPTS